jgi:PAS domain S-box-containing protein
MNELLEPDFKSIFESVSGLYLILSPDLTIVAVSDAYLAATMTRREEILGLNLFDVFPDNPDDPAATGVSNLMTSLNYVLENALPHNMAVQKYDIRRPDGSFEERFWSPLNKPILNEKKEVIYILHRVEDVTEFMRLKNEELKQMKISEDLKGQVEEMGTEIFKRAHEIQDINRRLVESERQIQSIFDSAPDAIITIDQEGKITKWNPMAETLFGWNAREVTGKFLSDTIIPYRYREAHRKGLEGFLRTGEGPVLNKTIEIHGMKKNNAEFDVALRISPAFINNKYLFIGFIRDITEQKKTEEKFKALLDSAPDAMVIANENGVIEIVNQQTEKIFGYQRDELIGQLIELLIPQEYHTRHVPHRMKYFKDPNVRPMGAGLELYGLRKEGIKFPVEISLSPIHTEKGTLISAAIRDISEKKKAEEKFKALLDSAPDAMVVVNSRGEIVLINIQTEKIFGYRRDELLGQKVEVLIPERYSNNHVRHRENFFVTARTRNMGAGLQLFGKKKDGAEFPVEISLSPLQTAEGLLVSAAIRDITEKKQMEDQIREANVNLEKKVLQRTAELENKNKELEQFAYVTSHDLREPLTTTSGFIELFRKKYKGKLDEDADKMLDYLLQANERMKVLIKDLLDYSRIGRKTELKLVDCNTILKDVTADLGNAIQNVKAIVNIERLPVINGYPTELKLLFQNLISNSIKFRKPKETPVVTVRAERKNASWQFCVEDNGIGIDEKHRERIFVIFQRLHPRSEYEGSGIGLAHCKKIVELHGGKIWVESVYGKGASFYFTVEDM